MIHPVIHILDYRTETILGTLENKEEAALFWDDKHKQELKDNKETFDFTMQANVPEAEFVQKRNRVVIPDEDGFYREFIIFQARQSSDKTKQVYTNASYTELAKQKIIEPVILEGQTITTAANYVLTGTEWQLGITEFSGTRKIEFEDYKNALEAVKQIASVFELEVRFRVEIKGNRIAGRYVDFLEKVGNNIGKEIEFGKDLIGITRTENSDIVTALVGLGPEKENGTREIVRIYDEGALQRWGRNGHHLWGIYTPETSDLNMTKERLTQLTRSELKKRINTSVQYEADTASIEHIFGYEHEKVRLGDTVRIKDTSFIPPLYLDARVISVERAVSNQSEKKFILGDFIEYKEEDIMAKFENLKALLDLKESVAKSPTPPENPYDNQLWIDTSDPTQDIWKRWDAETQTWVEGPGGPPGPEGEDGYTPIKGVDYFDGKDGQDGQSSYLWIRYSQNDDGSNMTTDPTNAIYIGITATTEPTAPTDYTAYNWALIKGKQGIPGEKGADGKTSYLHIKYSNDGGNTFTSNNGETVGDWIGTYTDFTQADSIKVTDYTWNKVKGEQGIQGPSGKDGKSLYTWVKYADSPTSGMSDYPDGKEYIGIAYNKTTPTESSNYSDYTWSLVKGEKGDTGAVGPKGADGVTTYTWIKYADDEKGNEMSDSPEGKRYLGIAYNKTTSTESNNPSDYSWSPLYDNVQVGGRNLLRKLGGNNYDLNQIFADDRYQAEIVNIDGKEWIKVNLNGDALFRVGTIADLEPHTEYTWSFDAFLETGSSDITIGHWGNHPSEGYSYEDVLINEEKKRISNTFTTRDDTSDILHIWFSDYSLVPYLANFKLEKGNIATDWTPAPEDVQEQIDSNETRISTAESTIEQHTTDISLKVNTQTFNSTVNNITGGITDLEGRINTAEINIDGLNSQISLKADATVVNEIKSRVSSAEIAIDGLESEIDLKVNEDGVISAINLSSGSAKIQANKINLVGAVTVLSDITGNLGTITAGAINGVTITGATVRTSSGGNRIEMSNSSLKSYMSGIKRIELNYSNLNFFDENGVYGGGIHSGAYESQDNSEDWEPLLYIDSKDWIEILADAGGLGTPEQYKKYGRFEAISGGGGFSTPCASMQAANNSTPASLGVYANPGVAYGSFAGDIKSYFSFSSRVFIDSMIDNNLGFPNGRYVEYKPDSNAGTIVNEWVLGRGSGYPDANSFWYLHTIFYANLNFRLQIAYGYGNDRMFTRRLNNGTWSAWTEH